MRIPAALRYRNYVLLWIGLLVSVAGSQMQVAAIHWHIRELTGEPDPLALGAIGLARILPVVVFSVVGGAVADTFNRRLILFVTQLLQTLIAAAFAVLTFSGHISIWTIYVLTALQASAMAFDLPARQAMVPNLVPARDLPSAFSMSSIAFNAGAIAGPALGGIVIASLGQAYTYVFNALSYLAVLGALLMMGHIPQDLNRASGVNPRAMLDGVHFIFSRPLILSTMITDFFATFFASANTMMPIVARDILKVNEVGYGWLVSAQSIGSVLAGLAVSQIPNLRRQGPLFVGSVAVFGAATIWFGLAHSFILAMAALVVIGVADGVSTIIRNTIRQLQTPDHIRGRMTSINQIFFMGGPQFGEVEAGIVGRLLGVPFAIVSGGIGTIVAAGWIIARWPMLLRYNGDEPLPPAD